MSMIWFTADLHLGHDRIRELANRPFSSVEEMNTELVDRWNAYVCPNDTTYILGDVALGKLTDSLEYLPAMNGRKILIAGNHDRVFKGHEPQYIERFRPVYAQYFDEIHDQLVLSIGDELFRLSHLPYVGDSHDDDRFVNYRPVDDGIPLLCGHVHDAWKSMRTPGGTIMINMGVDVCGFAPVSSDQVLRLYRALC